MTIFKKDICLKELEKFSSIKFLSPFKAKNLNKNLIGVELEFFPYEKESLTPLGHGKLSINSQDILLNLHKKIKGSILEFESQNASKIINQLTLTTGDSFSIEPGGQIEISAAPQKSITKLLEQLIWLFEALESVSKDITFISHGTQPLGSDNFPFIINKARYQSLKRYFNSFKNGRGTEMMRFTSSIQTNLDISNSNIDFKSRLAGISILILFTKYIFSNSFCYNSKVYHHAHERLNIWEKTDPSRTGLPYEMFFKSDYILGYVEWALKANVLRIENLEMEKQPKFSELTFEDWVKKGPFKGIKASQKSWELHLTTLFPDIRLKNFFEFRNSDALPFQHSLVPAVFFSEVLYNEKVHENMNILLLSIFKSEDAFNQCHEINTLAKALINKEKECYHILNCPKKHLIILENLLMNIEQTEDYKLKVRILESFVNDYNKKQLFPESCLDFVKDNQIDKPSRLLKSLL